MGKRNRERIERILVGKEQPISASSRRKIVQAGIQHVQSSSTSSQVQFLANSLHSGRLSDRNLHRELAKNAHKEMVKGVAKLTRANKPVTVGSLLAEYDSEPNFQALATEVGLDRAWFIALAETTIAQSVGR